MRYLVPMAGQSEFFPKSDYTFPKPLVEIGGRPMIAHVIDGIQAYDSAAEFIFVVRKDDCDRFSLDSSLNLLCNHPCKVVRLLEPTRGSACTALMAIEEIADDEPLVICNGDQVINANIKAINDRFLAQDADAAVITFPSVHPRWSYAAINEEGFVVEVAEKRVVSRRAIAGYYFFRRGQGFVDAAMRSIDNNASVDGRFYIAPTLNEFILSTGRVIYHDIKEDQYHSIYSPHRVETYERWLEVRALAEPIARKPLQIVIPMAGLGSRFANAGYDKPKPFIDVDGATMIERVLGNLQIPDVRFILLARQEHIDAEAEIVRKLLARGDVEIVPVSKVTEGAACTIALARPILDPNAPMLIANCDQIIDFECRDYIQDAVNRDLAGSILVFHDKDCDTKWSFAKLGPDGLVTEVQEKKAISELATVGLYYFAKAKFFLNSLLDMIARNERVNNEFYVCPVYNYLIAEKKAIGVFEVGADAMHGIGTPKDLDIYLDLLKMRAA
jgi:NDP-sugar pyrophosphorylase family protein